MDIPSKEECMQILLDHRTPSNVIAHVKAVCLVSEKIIQRLRQRKIPVKERLVIAAALLHDIERDKKDHVIVGANLVRKLGYPKVAAIMEKHSLYRLEDVMVRPNTIEEKIVFYADKRALHDKIVRLEERFSDIKKRHNVSHLEMEYEFTKKIEKELLEDNLNL